MYSFRVALRVWFLCNLCYGGLLLRDPLGLRGGPEFVQRTWIVLGALMPWIMGVGMNLLAAALFFVSQRSIWRGLRWLWWINEGMFFLLLVHKFIFA